MNLRRLSPRDWATWRDIRLGALAGEPRAPGSALLRERGYDEARWRRLMHPRWGVKVVAEAPEPVGMVAATPQEGHVGGLYLYSMWVAPLFRGRGVGAALAAEVLAWAREHGWRHVQLRVLPGNVAARRLYERLGFTGEGEVMRLAVS
ncbi:GNAT family N-acetyltransferase [Saccharothrix algeriensis]|uniref:GNAT family N-acetyltransferase n=1 Tax=Saccharothrix algeriensis TaxID=173560 RepID=A0A8T8HUT1_9PSEU|nr:GNAT family N-acetyltransferase [Saccharothrix algeriensis]MBM7813667.1 ribosomal protein S18 acetylase RimI-like enzyme [Saccharothrix algeriensis]QTR02141.1 GNAT family N-acetyltransferase [Saccharothrix algeriensis]